ncbi:helix-turn-helix domain-containing protein [Staphylococcus auricularis]|uniref:helix-turn-helix domain-containing protein n=1 Tax=Staphylococcus auricularis TaxID=29379 RepID=UPI003EBF038E
MESIIHYAHDHAHTYKTEKSVYNILYGKKSHQTFFDACSQRLMSLYHILPELKYTTFESMISTQNEDSMDVSEKIKIHPRFSYDSLSLTFKALQLLIQTVSHVERNNKTFMPLTEQAVIQKGVKQLFYYIQNNALVSAFIDELYQLFKHLDEQQEQSVLHYYLQGYEEAMYTRQQISLIEGLDETEVFRLEYNSLVEMMYELEDVSRYPILNQLIVYPPLSYNTNETYMHLQQGKTMDQIARLKHVKINTIEDHILELFIKGYISDYTPYVSNEQLTQFKNYYFEQPTLRLREYKEMMDELDYFQIKLLIVGIERGDLGVTTSVE